MAITSSSKDLDTAITLIRKFDPSGYIPGIVLPKDARLGYFSVKSFFITSQLQPSDVNRVIKNHSSLVNNTTTDTIDFWRRGIQEIYDYDLTQEHPTLRLLHTAIQEYDLSQHLLSNIIDAREREMSLSQHETLNDMEEHAAMSYGSLLELVLECSGITRLNDKDHDAVYDTARNVGIATGLSSVLRSSIPLASSGSIVIPMDLCHKYHVRNPRYLLSVLGQGDDCQMTLRRAVADLVNASRIHLDKGRKNRARILSRVDGSKAAKCFLPGIAAETFLNRLERSEFNLTDSNLRNTGMTEHALCSGRMWKAALFRQF